ncbi:hypothetical protein niasHT_000056 [Heterodera trifolii]|uniref:Uncharacterized protein n=1 Tax=Heterodera trifolii TaxID=157864 RepID=A0ABD2MCP8_9BILA
MAVGKRPVIRRVRREIDAPPPVPDRLATLILPDPFKTYARTEEQMEQFLLADSGVYQENGREQRILKFGRELNGLWANEMRVLCRRHFSITPMPFQHVAGEIEVPEE